LVEFRLIAGVVAVHRGKVVAAEAGVAPMTVTVVPRASTRPAANRNGEAMDRLRFHRPACG
jgi:hypothetical protein